MNLYHPGDIVGEYSNKCTNLLNMQMIHDYGTISFMATPVTEVVFQTGILWIT